MREPSHYAWDFLKPRSAELLSSVHQLLRFCGAQPPLPIPPVIPDFQGSLFAPFLSSPCGHGVLAKYKT